METFIYNNEENRGNPKIFSVILLEK